MGSSASLDRSSKKNWVENSGGLPPYVREIARSIEKSGKTLSQAISIALSRIKLWATGKGVKPDTQAKAAKALAQWEKTRATNAARKIEATATQDEIDLDVLMATAERESATIEVEPHISLMLGLTALADSSPGEAALSRILEAAGGSYGFVHPLDARAAHIAQELGRRGPNAWPGC